MALSSQETRDRLLGCRLGCPAMRFSTLLASSSLGGSSRSVGSWEDMVKLLQLVDDSRSLRLVRAAGSPMARGFSSAATCDSTIVTKSATERQVRDGDSLSSTSRVLGSNSSFV